MEQHRQGDVFLERVEVIPEGARKVKRDHGRVVLAYGEVTGHAHAIAERGADLFEIEGLEDRFLQVLAEGGVLLDHEEHTAQVIEQGAWRVRRQREYAPDAIRNVAD